MHFHINANKKVNIMIHTNEPANVFYVFLTAYRAVETPEVNEKFTRGMTRRIRTFAGLHGNVESTEIQGCFREAGQDVASIERTIKVRCTNMKQVAELTYLACVDYNQDAVLIVNSQTHTASLGHIEQRGEYPMNYPEFVQGESFGTLQAVSEASGECYSVDASGQVWEVL